MTHEKTMRGSSGAGLSTVQWFVIVLGLVAIAGFLFLDSRKDDAESSRDATADRSQDLALQVQQECAKGGEAAKALGTACKQARAIATNPVIEGTQEPAQKILIPGATITARTTVRTTEPGKPGQTVTTTAPGATQTFVVTTTETREVPGGTETVTHTETASSTTTETVTQTATATVTETTTCTPVLGCTTERN